MSTLLRATDGRTKVELCEIGAGDYAVDVFARRPEKWHRVKQWPARAGDSFLTLAEAKATFAQEAHARLEYLDLEEARE